MSPREPASRLDDRPVLWSMLALIAFAVPAYCQLAAPAPAWRATYRALRPAGPEAATVHRSLRQHGRPPQRWDKPVPLDEHDPYAVRFEGCLWTGPGEPLALRLNMAGREGALFLDGERVAEVAELPRGAPQFASAGARRELAAGWHALRVEYQGWHRLDMLALDASFDGSRPRAIPRDRLRLPAPSGGCP